MVCHHTDLGRTVDDRLWIAARERLIINALPRLPFDELDQIPSNIPYKDVIKITIAMCNLFLVIFPPVRIVLSLSENDIRCFIASLYLFATLPCMRSERSNRDLESTCDDSNVYMNYS